MRGASKQRLYIEEHGDGEPVLLIEGLGQSMWAWREQIPVFADHYRTIAFDTRGTGRSPVAMSTMPRRLGRRPARTAARMRRRGGDAGISRRATRRGKKIERWRAPW